MIRFHTPEKEEDFYGAVFAKISAFRTVERRVVDAIILRWVRSDGQYTGDKVETYQDIAIACNFVWSVDYGSIPATQLSLFDEV